KVIGRDIWIGLWSFMLAIVACYFWETSPGRKGGPTKTLAELWLRFPKFVLEFFAACLVMSAVAAGFSSVDFKEVLTPKLISPIKDLRTWTFVFTFLCIGLTTKFRELTKFGWKPFNAFTVGVIVNVPLGFILSRFVFVRYWVETIK
ncbi:MAG: putative sulfate exporter family transporter, partial [Elusimicrobia bacterium]|nr:putative sulfate exporter family transporter [Elusimicrobiota bacterium]